jgi:hypothetical protein
MNSRFFYPWILLTVGSVLLALPGKAQDYSRIRIVRLSFVEGTVQYQRPGEDWQDAKLNLPIQEGFSLRTADGFAEVEFEDSMAIRLATNSTLEFTGLALQDGGRTTQLKLPQGTAIISAKPRRGDTVSITASDLTVKLPRTGRFRVDASPTASWVTVLHGKVEIESDSGTASVSGGHALHRDANGSASTEIAANPPQDDFDKWVLHRENALNAAQSETSSMMSLNTYTAGFADMYNFGVWSYIPGYGAGWMPYGVGAGWMPFMNGGWQFMGVTGWNWVSGEPWGWLPYHFGSWVNAPGIGWAWLPIGPASWSPATASWVRVNNQLGWIPNGPVLGPKATKSQLAAVPATAILATRDASGAITAGASMPLGKAPMNMEAATAPSPVASGAANSKSFVQSAPALLARGAGALASFRAPSASTLGLRVGQFSSAPQALMAPHSLPAPAIARGASTSGFRGGFGANGSGSARMTGTNSAASPATSTQAPSVGGTSRGGSMGSSSSHH